MSNEYALLSVDLAMINLAFSSARKILKISLRVLKEVFDVTEVFVYVLDLFIPTDLTKREVLKAFDEDKLKPFEFIREIVKDNGVKGIKGVDLYDTLFKGNDFLLEYTVDFANGRIAVKVIGSNDPRKMLRDYYSYIEKRFNIR